MHSFLLITIFKFPAFSFPLLISARFLIGLSCGISAYIVPTCIAIAATPRRRHVIGILPPVFLSAGFLICLVSGYIFIKTDVESLYNSNNIFFKSIGAQPLFGIILNFIGLLTTLIFDEKATSDEWVSYITTSDYDPLIGDTVGFTSRLKEQFRLLKQPHIQRQLMVGLILPLQQLMGINVILFKATSIFEPFFSAKSENKSHPALIGVIIGVLYFITSFFVPFISHFLKRKLILYIGAFLIFITDVSLAFIYYFNYNTSVALPILGMFYIMVFCLSWGPFPWLVISEVFDARIRSSALTISSCLLWLAMFGITVFYAPLLDYSRPYGVFILLAGFSIVSIIFVHYFIPETKYLSLEEIQEYFKRQSIIS